MRCHHSLILALVAISANSHAAEKKLPVVFEDNFEKGASRWEAKDKEGWRIQKSDRGRVYAQFKKKSSYKPPYRSPFHMSLVKDVLVKDFELTVKVRSTHEDYGHRDVCLFFGFQNPAQFYYVHLGKKADDHANQIFIVNKAARTKISTRTTPGTDWDDKWHNVKIVRRVKTGVIEIYFDDMKKPVMTAKNKAFAWGRVGLGSFDDTAAFDDFILRGETVKAEARPAD